MPDDRQPTWEFIGQPSAQLLDLVAELLLSSTDHGQNCPTPGCGSEHAHQHSLDGKWLCDNCCPQCSASALAESEQAFRIKQHNEEQDSNVSSQS